MGFLLLSCQKTSILKLQISHTYVPFVAKTKRK